MLFKNTTLSFLMLIVIALCVWSCGDDNNTNVSPSTNICSADVSGDTTFTFSSKTGLINNSTSQSEYLILQANIIDSKSNVTNLTLRFKDTGKYDVPFDLTRDENYGQLSFNNGAESYKSSEGTLTITEHVGKRVKATFSFKAVNQNTPSKIIEVKNGVFDFSL